MLRPVRIAALSVLALALVASPAAAAKPRKAPTGLAFYTPPKPLPAGKHGDLIWSRTVSNPLSSAARTTLVLYRSTAVDGKGIAVSGTVSVPRGKAPPGGWPVISWAHGTTGIADSCAPSRAPKDPYTAYIAPELNTWLQKGYAIARTDYEGLGTPGTHPYLIGHSEGRGVIDIVRAARELNPTIGKRWIAAGHSQGGHAALFAAADGPKWAPELRLRGVAAFAPASQVGTQARSIGAFTQPSGLSALAALIVDGAATASPNVKLAELLSDKALALLPQVDTKCLNQLGAADSFGGLAPSELERPGADTAQLLSVLDAQNPDLKITVPILLQQGLSDGTVFSFLTDQLRDQLKAKGDSLDYRTYPGVSHGAIVVAGLPAANTFLKKRFR
jgi:pimeloyl-ACP methyl ester carboxylesterase